MKKAFILPMLAAVLMAGVSQAVTVHWAVTTLPDLTQGGAIPIPANYEITSAVLVYVTSGIPVYLDNAFTVGTEIGDTVSGLAINPLWGIGQQDSVDSVEREEGNYYVVLFATDTSPGGSGQTYYTTSTTGLVWNNTTAITSDPMSPATGTYDPATTDPAGFSNWQPVPEPGAASLLFAGIAAAILRRRRRP